MCKGCRETARQIPALQAPPWEGSREQSLPHETFVLSRNLVPIQVVHKWEPIRVSSHPDCFFHCSGGRNTHTEWHGVSYCTKWYCAQVLTPCPEGWEQGWLLPVTCGDCFVLAWENWDQSISFVFPHCFSEASSLFPRERMECGIYSVITNKNFLFIFWEEIKGSSKQQSFRFNKLLKAAVLMPPVSNVLISTAAWHK